MERDEFILRKLLLITRKWPPSIGGMENAIYQIAQNLSDDNLKVDVIALGKKQINLLWFFPYILIYTMFNARKYDYLLLGDGLICMCGCVAQIASKKIKRMIILHGLDVSYNNKLYQMYLRMNLKSSADNFICNSNFTCEIVRRWGLTQNLSVIKLGIDVNKFDNVLVNSRDKFCEKYNISSDSLILLTVGRLVKRKGVEWFIREVLPQLDNVSYIVVGGGEEKENIERAIQDTDMIKKVRMLGRISEDELNNCYVNSDVFVMPNYHVPNNAEGFGLVALEASLAQAIPIVSNVDGIPDAIINGKNGYLIESQDAKSYYKAILDIEHNRDKYRLIAKQFKEYTVKHYSWINTCEQIRNIMRDMQRKQKRFAEK